MVARGNRLLAVDIFGPGYNLVEKGEVAHVINCTRVQVKTRTVQNCTKDLPIYYGANYSIPAFRQPITKQIVAYSPPVPCDPILPIMFQLEINGRESWYCLTPALTPCPDPLKLDPTVQFQTAARNYGAELGHKIYTDEQEDEHQQAMIMESSREGIVTGMGTQSWQQGGFRPNEGFFPGSPLIPDVRNGLVAFIGNQISPLFNLLGNFAWYAWCVLCAIAMARILFDFLTRAYWIAKSPRGAGFAQL